MEMICAEIISQIDIQKISYLEILNISLKLFIPGIFIIILLVIYTITIKYSIKKLKLKT